MCIEHLKYGELHAHTDFSDGFGKVEDNVRVAAELGLNALAVTEHGTLSGLVRHHTACQNAAITPILGCEFYLRMPEQWKNAGETRNSKSGRFHGTFLSTNWEGYKRLIKINNAAHQNMEISRGNRYPIVTFEMLEEFAGEGIVVLTGCVAAISFHDYMPVSYEWINFLTKNFGKENVYAEIMPVEITSFDGVPLNGYSRPLHLAEKFGLKTVWTNDVHAPTEDDLPLLELYTMGKKGYSFTAGCISSKETAFKTAVGKIGTERALKAFQGVDEIIGRIEPVKFKRDFSLPPADKEVKEMYEALDKALTADISLYDGIIEKQVLIDRFNQEKDLVEKYQFAPYFAVLWDILRDGFKYDVYNVARGSASGSYLLYLLGVTQLNPVEHGLMFERFLAELRLTTGELPDVDIDISSDDRHFIQEYAKRRWGFEPVGTVNRYSHSSLVRLIARIYEQKDGLDLSDKTIGTASNLSDLKEPLSEESTALETAEKSASFYKVMSVYGWAYKMYDTLLGNRSNFGAHACAVTPVDEEMPVPIEHWGNHPVVMYTENGADKTLQSIGYVKYDFLSLETLNILKKLAVMTGVKAPKVIKDGDSCFDVFNRQSLTGIFQFDTRPGRLIVKKMMDNERKISSIHQLAALTSIIRPGAAIYIDDYVGKTVDTSVHPPFIKQIYDKTDGVIVYQEQVAELFARVAFKDYDKTAKEYGIVALKSLVPKNAKVAQSEKFKAGYEKLHKMFLSGGVDLHGLDVFYLEELFASLVGFIRYGFNLSHALSYANLSAQMAWYKHNFPNQFWSIVLSGVDNSKTERDKLLRYIVDAVADSGLRFKAPHINTATTQYTIDGIYIQAPIDMVKGLGANTVQRILEARPFTSLKDVAERSGLNKTQKKVMYDAGMFDGLDGTLYDLGVLENKSYELRDKNGKWADAKTGLVTRISESDDGFTVEIDNNVCYEVKSKHVQSELDAAKKLKIALDVDVKGLSVGAKILFYTYESCILCYKKVAYQEPVYNSPDKEAALKIAIGFALPEKLPAYVKFAEERDNKVVGYITEIYEKTTEKGTRQLKITLQDGSRAWVCLQEKGKPNLMLKSKVNIKEALELKLGDLVGITYVMAKKDNIVMTYGQVEEFKILG